jgi:acyl-CoA thioester hydrolase
MQGRRIACRNSIGQPVRSSYNSSVTHRPFQTILNTESLPEVYEIPIAVQAADIDRQNHVNNTVYVRWIQEVATAHWEARASAETRDAIGWVVLRHEIDYKSPAGLGDELVLRTWVGQATRATFERFVEVVRKKDRQLVAQARTLWVPINPETAKPTRVPPEVRARFST